ncbi:hypothetical protein Ae406Ps2_4845 [Pseudonocardia sp. Ae406_Ps2]|nr:hypothetical protein Ae406Ps2_4845 [Pseudonocardia sp. Ae406_Ps2]
MRLQDRTPRSGPGCSIGTRAAGRAGLRVGPLARSS